MDIKEYIQAGSTIKRHPWELARLKILKYFIRKTVKDPHQIADIGSGDAFIATGIATKYKEATVTAVDINYEETLLTLIQKEKPSNLFFSKEVITLDTEKSIDAIVLMDVLEHIEDPEKLLQQLLSFRAVNQHTRFIITVPAYQQLFSEHDKNLGHFKRYNLSELNNLLAPLSLKIIHSGYCFNMLLPLRWIQVKKEKKTEPDKTVSEGIHNWKGSRFTKSLITCLFWIEFKISWYLARIGIKLPGLTCYCICKPSPL